ncbi:NADH-ubiquinone oxidoreductase [Tropilaelaps mercedesae]|uniref:NADH dehydrogenase [ubiquinone] 1 beta subcomplex subunit 10 n=1 Tax=Tropilaelaps mercedesae TaxID=418985 RepID=A0A1V9XG94_9ACAR|nr:NADH-ubiquinone oxidoreductase [Tropilaelaps mercedesae]
MSDPHGMHWLEKIYEKAFLNPVVWIRENIVEPNRPKYYWYHRKYPRVPEIDECYFDDFPCQFEADRQFKRDMHVEAEILRLIRRRYTDCLVHEYPDQTEKCAQMEADWKKYQVNWFIKYGDLGYKMNARDAYMKQKHRLVFERRQREKAELEAAQHKQFDD